MKTTVLENGALRLEAADGAERFFLRYLAESPSGIGVLVNDSDDGLETIVIGRRPENPDRPKPKPPIRPIPDNTTGY